MYGNRVHQASRTLRCCYAKVGWSLMNPYWIKIEGIQLAIVPRPRGQDWLPDDISLLRRAGVDVVVSALTPSENEELGLVDESQCCEDSGMKFLAFPIEDRSVPISYSEFSDLVDSVIDSLRKGKGVAVHCSASGKALALIRLTDQEFRPHCTLVVKKKRTSAIPNANAKP